ncbi:MAG: hypothetical protein NVS4B9_36390 [Ktedonobacteraceae bacterium]
MEQRALHRATRMYTWYLPYMLMVLVLFFSSCNSQLYASQESGTTPHVQAVEKLPVKATSTSSTSSSDSTATDANESTYITRLHQFEGPNGWIWRTSLPNNRLVIYYGNPDSAVMGPLGAYADDELVAKLQAQAQVYANLDTTHPVVPAFDYVTPVAQPVPMQDGSWVYRMPDDSISHYIDLANSNHMLFFFDMQIGHSPIQKEVNILWQYLQMPGVELSLDPEFDMAPGAVPGVQFGRMPAKEINWVIDQLSNLVQTHHLPPKILIIHQFLPEMLPDWQNIKLKAGVQVVTCVDGFGPPGAKINDYVQFDREQLIQYAGMKLFYKLDKPLMSPADVLALNPSPLMVMYQ